MKRRAPRDQTSTSREDDQAALRKASSFFVVPIFACRMPWRTKPTPPSQVSFAEQHATTTQPPPSPSDQQRHAAAVRIQAARRGQLARRTIKNTKSWGSTRTVIREAQHRCVSQRRILVLPAFSPCLLSLLPLTCRGRWVETLVRSLSLIHL